MNTKSAYVQSPNRFEIRDIELAPAARNEVLIRVEACGICGTDLSTASAKAENWQAFGHEIAGVIQELGDGCEHLSIGQSVVLESSSFCGKCDLCRNGRVDLCAKAPNFWGRSAMGFSQYMIAPLACIVPYENLSPEAACLAEPAGVAFDMVKIARIALGESVALVGPGPIGLMAIPLAIRSGASRVVCIGRAHSQRRMEVAAELGAEIFATNQPLNEHAELAKQFDHVLLTSPVNTIPDALSLLKYGGELTYIGIGESEGNITFDANDFHFRKLQLRASMASPAIYYPVVLDFLRSGAIPADKIISHRFGLDEIETAMRVAREDKAGAVKVVVTP